MPDAAINSTVFGGERRVLTTHESVNPMIPEAALTSFFAALFFMMNPIGTLGVFAGMMEGRPGSEAPRIAGSCAALVAVTLLIINKPGYLVNAQFSQTSRQLIISAEDFRAVLNRQ